MIFDSESGVEGNKSEYNDSESDSYSSDNGDHSGESEGSRQCGQHWWHLG